MSRCSYCDVCCMSFSPGDDPDPCFGGEIPGVAGACCGHGDLHSAYVMLGTPYVSPGGTVTLRGRNALTFFALLARRGEWRTVDARRVPSRIEPWGGRDAEDDRA